MSNEKHEEVAKELFEVTRQRDLACKQIIKSILSKHYDAEPELTIKKGDWYLSVIGLVCLIKIVNTRGLLDGIKVDGTTPCLQINPRNPRNTPHTFTRPDLKLLNTEVLDYVLDEYHDGNDTPFFVTVTDKEGSDVMTFYGFKTAHLAVLSAYNAVLAENLRLKAVK